MGAFIELGLAMESKIRTLGVVMVEHKHFIYGMFNSANVCLVVFFWWNHGI